MSSTYDYTQPAQTNNEWNRVSLGSSQGPPGYPLPKINTIPGSSMSTTTPADSVLELKRALKDHDPSPTTTSTSGDSSPRTSSDHGSSGREEDNNHEYQTMDRPTYDSTFRPPNTIAGRQLPQVPSMDRIPSVPGYAKPYARPFEAPTSPPPSPPRSRSRALLETSFDDPIYVSRRHETLDMKRSRSVGQILETNFDDPEPKPGELSQQPNGHSRSMDGQQMAKLSLAPQLLETGL